MYLLISLRTYGCFRIFSTHCCRVKKRLSGQKDSVQQASAGIAEQPPGFGLILPEAHTSPTTKNRIDCFMMSPETALVYLGIEALFTDSFCRSIIQKATLRICCKFKNKKSRSPGNGRTALFCLLSFAQRCINSSRRSHARP